jgi:bifunctional non-homologous end joining protein LigD
LATLAHAVPTGPQWAYEIKHDGFRFLAVRQCDRVRLFSRRGIDHGEPRRGVLGT